MLAAGSSHAACLLLAASALLAAAVLPATGAARLQQQQHQAGHRSTELPDHAAGGCKVTAVDYVSGKVEQDWLANGEQYQQDANYCPYMTSAAAKELQDKVAQRVKGVVATALAVPHRVNPPPLLSQLAYTLQCGQDVHRATEAIEPLYATLRHPDSFSCPDLKQTQHLMSVSYLITAARESAVAKYAPRNYYFDVGASLFPELSQKWMLTNYETRGITFDRILMWEAKQMNGTKIHKDVPEKYYPAYQYFNFPASPDPLDRRNPLNMLKAVAKPEDFVALKLDIDAWAVENQFVDQIINDPSVHGLIDEFYFEKHFNWQPIIKCCWRDTIDKNATMMDTLRLFVQLRKLGIRAHYWP